MASRREFGESLIACVVAMLVIIVLCMSCSPSLHDPVLLLCLCCLQVLGAVVDARWRMRLRHFGFCLI